MGKRIILLKNFMTGGITMLPNDSTMSSVRTLNLIRSTKLNINNCNNLKSLTVIAYTLC